MTGTKSINAVTYASWTNDDPLNVCARVRAGQTLAYVLRHDGLGDDLLILTDDVPKLKSVGDRKREAALMVEQIERTHNERRRKEQAERDEAARKAHAERVAAEERHKKAAAAAYGTVRV